ncbi:hypothetical protein VTJ83DRAFT_495 [Remersonia thermophila]|uniref:Uncharacterized protein n=1 Tax=Remersonia thermophila TaxID=72144 RepID=A0ABR4DNK9_9PEZI
MKCNNWREPCRLQQLPVLLLAATRPPNHRHLTYETIEIMLSFLSSLVIWQFTVHTADRRATMSAWLDPEDTGDGSIFRPPPGLVLFACLMFGCCVSSFVHRRRGRDRFQAFVYLVVLGSAALVGYSLTADAHLVLLGCFPWATCAAMVISMAGHGLYRCLRPQVGGMSDEEKRTDSDALG